MKNEDIAVIWKTELSSTI